MLFVRNCDGLNLSAGSFMLLYEDNYKVLLKRVVESKGSNQGILDAVRQLVPNEGDKYYLAFDIVYDNMDVMNKYLELRELVAVYPKQIVILDGIFFEYIILSFGKLIEWTGTGKKR